MRRSFIRRRKPMKRVNRRRLAKLRAQQFGVQAELCRRMPCCTCHPALYAAISHLRSTVLAANDLPATVRRSDPAHVPGRKMGGVDGKDENTVPLCRSHHTEHDDRGCKTFEAKYGLNLRQIAAQIHEEMKRCDEVSPSIPSA